MNQKKITILAVMITFLLIVSGVFYAVNNAGSMNDNSSITSDHYYVEKGLEKFAKFAKPAVENFASQDNAKSVASRNQILGNYFTKDSPVYTYSLDNLSPSINKTTAKLTSVVSYGGEDSTYVVSVIVDTTFYSHSYSFSNNQTYLLTFKKDSSGNYSKPNDIQEQST